MTHSEAPAGWVLPCERSRKPIPRAAPADNVLHKEALHTDLELNQRRIQTHQQSDPAVRSARGNTSHEAEAGNHSTHGKKTSHVFSGPEEKVLDPKSTRCQMPLYSIARRSLTRATACHRLNCTPPQSVLTVQRYACARIREDGSQRMRGCRCRGGRRLRIRCDPHSWHEH